MPTAIPSPANATCPVPLSSHEEIQIAHGGGGEHDPAIDHDGVFAPRFATPPLRRARHDGAMLLRQPAYRLAFSTDLPRGQSAFPGGDIGTLAVNGTINDLAMCGARNALAERRILEEGLPLATLRRVVASMGAAARAAGVEIVTGDTKVVERGKGDGLYVNTSGIGWVEHKLVIAPASVQAGDVVLLSGDIGRHGTLAQREDSHSSHRSTIALRSGPRSRPCWLPASKCIACATSRAAVWPPR